MYQKFIYLSSDYFHQIIKRTEKESKNKKCNNVDQVELAIRNNAYNSYQNTNSSAYDMEFYNEKKKGNRYTTTNYPSIKEQMIHGDHLLKRNICQVQECILK